MSKYQAYSEYKDSGVEWVGRLPSHWKKSQLRYMFLLSKGLTITKANLEDEGVPCVNYGEVHSKYGFEVDPKIHPLKYVSEDYLGSSPNALLSKGDLVYADTSEDIEGSGNFTQLISDEKVFAGYHTIIARPKDRIRSRYYAYLLDSIEVRAQIRYAVKGVKVFSITQEILRSINIWLPSFEESEKIANFLDHETAKIDTLIDKQQQLIQLLKEKRQAVISHAVTKGLNPNAPMCDSGVEWLGEVPEHWDIKKLKYLVNESLMYGANEAALDVNFENPRFVRITDVKDDGSLKDDTFRSLNEELAKPYLLKDGDILLARTGGTVGKSFMYSESWGRCCFAGYLIKASLNQSVLKAEWFYRYTQTQYYWEWIASSQIQATLPNVSADKYNGFLIAVPSIKEQIEILNNLQTDIKRFDEIISKAELVIQLMKERRTALISAAVTGKIDVRQHVSRPAGNDTNG